MNKINLNIYIKGQKTWRYGLCIDFISTRKLSRYFVVSNRKNKLVYAASTDKLDFYLLLRHAA